jgi:hypothetical protein
VIAFFAGLGLEVEGRTFIEGEFLDTVIGIPGSRTELTQVPVQPGIPLARPSHHGSVRDDALIFRTDAW